ncbi:MAG: AAA family ATPase [Methanobacteriota archaeon]|nr:MAG: AAA family ATPase [Euryarchaeota archaeon]
MVRRSQQVRRVFEAAKENAPSVIFIDDSDVITTRKQTRIERTRLAARRRTAKPVPSPPAW